MSGTIAAWRSTQHGSQYLRTTVAEVSVHWSSTRGKGYVVRLPSGRERDGFGDDAAAARSFAERWLRKALERSLFELGELGKAGQ